MNRLVFSTFVLCLYCGTTWATATELDDLSQKLNQTISQYYPDAKIEMKEDKYIAKGKTMIFTVHGRSMTGEYDPQPFQQEGPKHDGFLFEISLHKEPYDGQAIVPQRLHEPYWTTLISAPPTANGAGHYWIRFSYGSRTPPEFLKAVEAILPKMKSEKTKVKEKSPGEKTTAKENAKHTEEKPNK